MSQSLETLTQPQWMPEPAADNDDQPATTAEENGEFYDDPPNQKNAHSLNEWITQQTLASLAKMNEGELLEFSRKYAATDSHWSVIAMASAMAQLDEAANVQDIDLIHVRIRQVVLEMASAMARWHLRDHHVSF